MLTWRSAVHVICDTLFFSATKFVCYWEPSFAAYLAKMRAEGKHYDVAISHAAKKLVRLIFALQTSGKAFQPS